MNVNHFLAYIPDPFGVRQNHFCLLITDEEFISISPEELSKIEMPIITIEVSKLIDTFRGLNLAPPKNLVSMEDALILCSGSPKDEGGVKKKQIWPYLFKSFEDANIAQAYKDIFESKSSWDNNIQLTDLLQAACISIKKTWDIIVDMLNDSSEYTRFTKVEIPIRNIFNYREYEGIKVNLDVINDLLEKVSNEKYKAFQIVANEISRSPAGLNYWNLGPYLKKTDASHLSDEDGGNLKEHFKIASQNSKFAKAFLTYSDASSDEVVIQRAIGKNGRLYPIYQTQGTVTSRILVVDPYLQQLRRKYRSLIAPDENKKLIYLDYSQFEPGIFAFLSNDKVLIDSYNNGDIYESLSNQIYGNIESRALCKKIFLAFSYGMSSERIATLVSPANIEKDEIYKLEMKISDFFRKFPSLDLYKAAQIEFLTKNGYVESLFTNKRYRIKQGNISHKEMRWSLNHPIQATASLIFKEALIKISEQFGKCSILLPVHDAILMQLSDDESFNENVGLAKNIMIEAFQNRCPSINARIQASDFNA